MLKKNDIIDVEIKSVDFPNKGIGDIKGKKIIVKNTIEGQKVRVRIKKKRRNKIEGQLIEVIERASIEEADSSCEYFGTCGGCSYLNIPYENQLKLKENQVKTLLDNAGIKGYEFLGIDPSPNEYAYRNKMEYSFGDMEKGGLLSLGMHQRGKFYEIVTTESCQIVDEDFTKVLKTVLEYFRELKTTFYHKKTHKGYLRHLVVRKAIKTNELLVNLVTSSQQNLDLKNLVYRLQNLNLDSKLVGFLHTINDSLGDVVRSDETRILFGQDYITEEILGLKFKISAFSFFQTNSLGADKLYSIVRDFAGDTGSKVIFDLYCGTGTITQIMASIAKKVIGIEIVKEAIESAKENAKLNNLNNCVFIAGDVMEQVSELTDKPDIIILDPPRDGIHPKAINKIIDFNPQQFIYISCKPTSLVRDLPVFIERGYKVEKIKCIDMFPHTVHVESIILMTYCGSEEKQ